MTQFRNPLFIPNTVRLYAKKVLNEIHTEIRDLEEQVIYQTGKIVHSAAST
ncbi:hypothetical protein WDW89_25710 [Deltaproteobacteria bacterium TL4]